MTHVFRIPDKDLKTFWDIVTPTGAGLTHSTTSRDVYELLKSGGIEPDDIKSKRVMPTYSGVTMLTKPNYAKAYPETWITEITYYYTR